MRVAVRRVWVVLVLVAVASLPLSVVTAVRVKS